MKKKILLGLASLLVLMPFGVNAETLDSVEENNSADASVVVGEVETPVYDVEITWGALTYDWKYSAELDDYTWESSKEWEIYELKDALDSGELTEDTFEDLRKNICTDPDCNSKIAENVTYEDVLNDLGMYYYKSVAGTSNWIYIDDYSTGRGIIPSVKWTSAKGYDWVEGKFSYEGEKEYCGIVEDFMFDTYVNEGSKMYTDSVCSKEITEPVTEYRAGLYVKYMGTGMIDLTTEEIPEAGRQQGTMNGPRWYNLELNLENNGTATTPNAGDTIGTVTITIKAR